MVLRASLHTPCLRVPTYVMGACDTAHPNTFALGYRQESRPCTTAFSIAIARRFQCSIKHQSGQCQISLSGACQACVCARVLQPSEQPFMETLRSVCDQVKWFLFLLLLTVWGFACAFYILFRKDQGQSDVRAPHRHRIFTESYDCASRGFGYSHVIHIARHVQHCGETAEMWDEQQPVKWLLGAAAPLFAAVRLPHGS